MECASPPRRFSLHRRDHLRRHGPVEMRRAGGMADRAAIARAVRSASLIGSDGGDEISRESVMSLALSAANASDTPAAAARSRALSTAAPRPRKRSRLVGSLTGKARAGSQRTAIRPSASGAKRQGCVLCAEGAMRAPSSHAGYVCGSPVSLDRPFVERQAVPRSAAEREGGGAGLVVHIGDPGDRQRAVVRGGAGRAPVRLAARA